jgi:DNA-binding transcriptional LysR family regulator
MDWDDVRHFLALARLGSVRAAGAELGVSHSTVARRVEALEARLAARLFDRNRDGYCLTEAGRRMLTRTERIEHDMTALERDMVGQDERLAGVVTITCSDTYVSQVLLHALAAFCERYPDLELAITPDGRIFDLAKREADIAIRALVLGDQPPEHLIGTAVAPVMVASYVAAAHETRLDPDIDGTHPRWLSFEERRPQEALIAQSSYPRVPAWGAFASLEVLVQATREGLGLAMLPTYVGDREPSLRRLARPDLRHVGDLWLLSHPDLRDNARFRATRACVAEAFKANAALFRGEWCPIGAPGCP